MGSTANWVALRISPKLLMVYNGNIDLDYICILNWYIRIRTVRLPPGKFAGTIAGSYTCSE